MIASGCSFFGIYDLRPDRTPRSTYGYVKEWLSEVLEETDADVSLVSVDIESHQKIEQGALPPKRLTGLER